MTNGIPEMRHVCAALAAFVILSATATAIADATQTHGAEPPSPLSLAWCLERAQSANPQIAVLRATHEASTERTGTVGAFDDPRFSYEASNIPIGDLDLRSTPLSGHQLGFRQKLPFPGLLSNREEAARSNAQAAGLDLKDRRRRVASGPNPISMRTAGNAAAEALAASWITFTARGSATCRGRIPPCTCGVCST